MWVEKSSPSTEITYSTKELQYLANMYSENKGNNKRVDLEGDTLGSNKI